MVLALLGFVVSLNLLNVDAFIVKQNVQRELRSAADQAFAQGRADLDAQYFLDLSDDAVPALVGAFQSNPMPVSVKEKIGAALACLRYEREQDERELPWQAFHLSRFNADRAFESISRELDVYAITDADFPVSVVTPGGEEFSCWQYHD